MRERNFTFSACLLLCMMIVLGGVLSSCGGGGGGSDGSRDREEEIVIMPPGNNVPGVIQSLENITMSVSESVMSGDLNTYFSDPDGDSLTYTATSSDQSVVIVRVDARGRRLGHRHGPILGRAGARHRQHNSDSDSRRSWRSRGFTDLHSDGR